MAGKPSEIDGLVYEVVRMGKLYGVPVPAYTKVANRLAREKTGSFFDMDGVLVNTEPLHFRCWQEVLKEDGITLDYEIYKPCIGSTREVFRQLMVDAYGDIFEDYPTMTGEWKKRKRKSWKTKDSRNVRESGKFWKKPYIRKDICWQSDLLLRRM